MLAEFFLIDFACFLSAFVCALSVFLPADAVGTAMARHTRLLPR